MTSVASVIRRLKAILLFGCDRARLLYLCVYRCAGAYYDRINI
jgi:hypothetical protein